MYSHFDGFLEITPPLSRPQPRYLDGSCSAPKDTPPDAKQNPATPP